MNIKSLSFFELSLRREYIFYGWNSKLNKLEFKDRGMILAINADSVFVDYENAGDELLYLKDCGRRWLVLPWLVEPLVIEAL